MGQVSWNAVLFQRKDRRVEGWEGPKTGLDIFEKKKILVKSGDRPTIPWI
jgi:hypothetical protein